MPDFPASVSGCLKKFSDLKRLNENDPNSEDVFVPTLIEDHYPARPKRLGHKCLYDFVRHIDWCHRDNEKTYRRLNKPRVPSHPVYDPEKPEQTDDYYYSLVLLFVPFWDKSDLLLPSETPEQAFNRLKNDGLLGQLKKMLKATSTKKKVGGQKKTRCQQK